MKQTLTQRIEALESQIMRMRAISIRPPYTAQASTSKQTTPVCCHCEKDVNKPITDSKPNKELRDKIMGLRSSRNFTTGIENEAYKDAIDDVLNLINK